MEKSFKYHFIEFIFRRIGKMSHQNRLKLGAVLSWAFPKLAKRRAHIVRTNLRLCFPEASEAQIEEWVTRNIRLTTQSFIDRGVLWYAPLEKIHEISRLNGFENLQSLLDTQQPTIILAPHFIGLDTAATVLTSVVPEGCTMYKSQRDPAIDTLIRKGRARFNIVHLLSRKEGFRGLVRFLKKGVPLYYLPDMDFGRDESIFVPFFNIQAATLPSTAQIAKMFNAKVTPVVTRLDIDTGIYHIEQLPALENFPGEDNIEEATARINQLLEEWIRKDPAQYYWVHRRFKTRPEGEAEVY
ncbi:MAG: lysophospholipid acyltransferase family protein [Pelistega sp.]|nr:lysophospholipid acyltransferase family protein [Pelistega sp.]